MAKAKVVRERAGTLECKPFPKAGSVVDIPDRMIDALVQFGYVERYTEPEVAESETPVDTEVEFGPAPDSQPETADAREIRVVEPEEKRTDEAPVKRGPGRPRKPKTD